METFDRSVLWQSLMISFIQEILQEMYRKRLGRVLGRVLSRNVKDAFQDAFCRTCFKEELTEMFGEHINICSR